MQLRKVSPCCLRSEFLDWFKKERKAISNVSMYHEDQGLYGQGVGCAEHFLVWSFMTGQTLWL